MVTIIIKNYINCNIKITNNSITVVDNQNKNLIIDFVNGDMVITSEKKEVIKDKQIIKHNEIKQEIKNKTINNNGKKIVYEWEEEKNLDIGRADDFEKMPKTKTIDEVKQRCIEIGSHLFIAKANNQYYIRSPPNRKKNRDYNSIKQKAEELRKKGKISLGWTSYILKPFNNN